MYTLAGESMSTASRQKIYRAMPIAKVDKLAAASHFVEDIVDNRVTTLWLEALTPLGLLLLEMLTTGRHLQHGSRTEDDVRYHAREGLRAQGRDGAG